MIDQLPTANNKDLMKQIALAEADKASNAAREQRCEEAFCSWDPPRRAERRSLLSH
jgi:hypothetical protein